MMRSLYTAGIRAYITAIRLASLWNPKAKAWIKGRSRNGSDTSTLPKNCIWIHCASAGEFEQGRPIIEALHAQYSHIPLLLTFFSPSGYELRKEYPLVHSVHYLPPDLPKAAASFIEAAQPQAAIFVKYEIWHNTLNALHQAGIPSYLVSAKFRAEQVYFAPWGKWFTKSLHTLKHIFSQDPESTLLLHGIGVKHVSTAGDTRFDRVLRIAKEAKSIPEIQRFKGQLKLLVAGSTWAADEALLLKWHHAQGDNSPWKLVLVPHELSKAHIDALQKRCGHAALWSHADWHGDASVLIVDTMGLLSRIYAYADMAYVGGGFGAGIHNTLEAAVYGCPVVFGPRYAKFGEALGLIECGAAYAAENEQQLMDALNRLGSEEDTRTLAGKAAAKFVENGAGATGKIIEALRAELNLGA